MRSRSVIARSNQNWKLILGVTLLIGGAFTDAIVSFVVLLRRSVVNNNWLYDLQAASTALAAAAFVYLCVGIRCPQCGSKWIWMGVTGKLNPKSLDTLLTLERCPTCGHSGDSSREQTDCPDDDEKFITMPGKL